MLLSIKPGVRVRGVSNEILLAVMVAQSVFENFKEHMTITSITDGRHKEGSLHYIGEAIDLRLPQNPTTVCNVLREHLGNSYDVVLEKDHIHVEYDPK